MTENARKRIILMTHWLIKRKNNPGIKKGVTKRE